MTLEYTVTPILKAIESYLRKISKSRDPISSKQCIYVLNPCGKISEIVDKDISKIKQILNRESC